MNIKMIAIGAVFVIAVMGASVGSSIYIANHVVAQAQLGGEVVEVPVPDAPPVYVELQPFIVNFIQDDALRYLQLTVQLMSREPDIADEVSASRPEIRNALILVLSGNSYADLVTREGKEAIREEIRREVNDILGRNNGIESVFLTGFVMQ